MTVHGRFTGVLTNSPVWDYPPNALPGADIEAVRANIPAWAASANLAAIGSGVAIGVPIYLRRGDLVTALTFVAGGTGAATPTNWWHALYDPDGTLMAQTPDQGTAAWAADTAKKLNLTAPLAVTRPGWYTAATMMAAATVNTLAGAAPLAGIAAAYPSAKPFGRTFGSGLTGTAPATIQTPAAVAKCPLVLVS